MKSKITKFKNSQTWQNTTVQTWKYLQRDLLDMDGTANDSTDSLSLQKLYLTHENCTDPFHIS